MTIVDLHAAMGPPPVLPLCEAPEPETVCTCGGSLLAYINGQWQHVDQCIECVGTSEPCWNREQHIGCIAPEPVTCVHGADWNCNEPVSLEQRCAYTHPDRSCCGCCWQTADD